jgi:NYN domain
LDRCALFVDAGYVLAEGAQAVHGTRNRDSVSWDYAGLLKLLGGLSRDRTGLPLLRCYWYDTAAEGGRAQEHETLADVPGVKLRLSKARPNRKEGVEAEIRKDLCALARNHAVSDAVIVSAEEDLAPVIAEVQDLGIRAILLHISADGNWAISRSLRQECDDIIDLSAGHLRPYVDLIAGAEPGSATALGSSTFRELPAAAAAAAASAGAASSIQSGEQPAIAAPVPQLYPSPVAADFDRLGQPQAAQAAQLGREQQSMPPDPARYSGPGRTGETMPGTVGQPQPDERQVLPAQFQLPDQGRGQAAQPGYGQNGFSADPGQPGNGQSRGAHAAGLPGLSQPTATSGPNGFPPGGLGRPENGVSQHGPVENGALPGGAGQNGMAPNGPGPNMAVPNAALPGPVGSAGLGQNGAGQNGVSQNGVGQNGAGPNGMPTAFGQQPGSGLAQPGMQSALHSVPGAPAGPSAPGAQPGSGLPGGPGQHGPGSQPGVLPGQHQPAQHQSLQPQPGQPLQGQPGQFQPGQFQNGQPQSSGLPGQGAHAAHGLSTSQSQPGIPAYQQGPAGGGLGQPGPGQQPGQPAPGLPPGQHALQQAPGQGPQRPAQSSGLMPASGLAPGSGGLIPGQQNGLGPAEPPRATQQRPAPPANGMQYPPDRGGQYGGQPPAGQFGGPAPYPVPPYGGMSAPPPPVTISVGEAVQSAHAEGFGFGEAVARDAPALWLEAVLARKPRMPSDLEARLLQGSALPIDSLLHDEVRHALRRGFWDALERSRH